MPFPPQHRLGALREETVRLATELEKLATAKDTGDRQSTAALAEQAIQLSGTMEEIKALEASVEAGNNIIAVLNSQVNQAKRNTMEGAGAMRERT